MSQVSARQQTRQKPEERRDFHRILVAVDGSENAERASQIAVDLASKYASELIVLHVITRPTYANVPMFPTPVPPPREASDEFYNYAKKVAEGYVGRTVAEARRRGVNVRREIREAVPSTVQGIAECAADEKVDLIVIGTRGLGGFKKLLIGSVSSGVVAHAQCPVLVVR